MKNNRVRSDLSGFMLRKYIIHTIGIIELLIGLISLVSSFLTQISFIKTAEPKPLNVYIFLVVTSTISVILGIGMLNLRSWARYLLIFFSGYIILTKVFIYSGLMIILDHKIIFFSDWIIDATSAIYHLIILVILVHFARYKTA